MIDAGKLLELNHWWKLGKVREEFALPYKRKLFQEILKYLDTRQIIGVVGLRRVGKSTLFYQIIDFLIKKGTSPESIIYFSFDESRDDIREILKVYEENIAKKRIGNERVFVFLDEIQKLEDWQNKIKAMYDLYPNIKFFISGSASINILLPAKESLAGRIFYFDLDLLSFQEFLELRKKNVKKIMENINLWKRELRIEMNEYLLKPFPEIVDFPDEMAKKYLKESIVEKVILKDLSGLFEVREIEAIEKIIAVIGSEPGLIMNLEDMSKDFGIGRQALSNYLYYLQCCFLIRQLKNFRGSFKAASRKLKKYYLLHPCFSLAYGSETGKIMENLVAFKTKSDYYWREGGKEVDFIIKDEDKKITPIEIKYKRQIKKSDLKNLVNFMELFKAKPAIVITDDTEGKMTINGKTINLIPVWKWLL